MENKDNTVNKVDIVFMMRKIGILGIAILLGIIIVYGMGLIVPGSYINEELAIFNLISLIVCGIFCVPSFYVKKFFLSTLNEKNFLKVYFNAHLIPFAMCDLGGLFCVVTNLFVNQNTIYATSGFILAVLFMIINFPRSDDYIKLKV
ncbi:MAG: hypothetical protein WC358_02670 [Ignavibacteria bacterium]|jgi:magnesium-transporting ATPase (P-type)